MKLNTQHDIFALSPPSFIAQYLTFSETFGCSGFCKNSGICSLSKNTPTCSCPPGFTGPRCERVIASCEENPCKNEGQCKMVRIVKSSEHGLNFRLFQDTHAGFVCQCPEGFEGRYCQVQAKSCLDRPCQNGANCIRGSKGFHCNCTTFWEGSICDIPVTFCRADSCLHGKLFLKLNSNPKSKDLKRCFHACESLPWKRKKKNKFLSIFFSQCFSIERLQKKRERPPCVSFNGYQSRH